MTTVRHLGDGWTIDDSGTIRYKEQIVRNVFLLNTDENRVGPLAVNNSAVKSFSLPNNIFSTIIIEAEIGVLGNSSADIEWDFIFTVNGSPVGTQKFLKVAKSSFAGSIFSTLKTSITQQSP